MAIKSLSGSYKSDGWWLGLSTVRGVVGDIRIFHYDTITTNPFKKMWDV